MQDKVTPLNILVVDDNEASAQMLGWMLEMYGHTYELAYNAHDAFKKAKASHPDVVLMDITLPDMSGYELCRKMRQDPDISDSYLVAQTGWDRREDREKSQAAGFDCHLGKPINEVLLRDALTMASTPQRKIA